MLVDAFENLEKRARKWGYYLLNASGLLFPRAFYRSRLEDKLRFVESLSDEERNAVWKRVDYYNKLRSSFDVKGGYQNSDFKIKLRKSAYYFDFLNVAKYFPRDAVYCYWFGDKIEAPDFPCFVKSRPIDCSSNNENSVLLKLNKIRHYYRVVDKYTFESKKAIAVWRGAAHQKHRQDFLHSCFGSDLLDVGATDQKEATRPFRKKTMSVREQLEYKFIISIEGNDVATNLKWVMSSNSLCFMRRPRYETWFMEGLLVPNYHYVCLKDDFSDLEKKVEYYSIHTVEAKSIIKNANRHAEQFYDEALEGLVSFLVFEKYVHLSRCN